VKPLFITAHYDDLEVCAGGTAKRYGGISIVIAPKPDCGTEEQASVAADILGIEHHPASQWPIMLSDIEPLDYDTVISVSPHDSHPEHQQAASLARQLARRNDITLWFMAQTNPHTNTEPSESTKT